MRSSFAYLKLTLRPTLIRMVGRAMGNETFYEDGLSLPSTRGRRFRAPKTKVFENGLEGRNI